MRRLRPRRQRSQLVEPGTDHNAYGLVEGATHGEPLLVLAPVPAVDGLRAQLAVRQAMDLTTHAVVVALCVLRTPLVGVRVLCTPTHEHVVGHGRART